jgi:adenylate cyclase
VAVVFALNLAVVAGVAHGAGVFGTYRELSGDLIFPRGTTDPRVTIVGVDDATLEAFDDDWPFPRETQALLAERILASGAEAVVFDIVFDAPRDGDDAFAAAIAGKPVILSARASSLLAPTDLRRAYTVSEQGGPGPSGSAPSVTPPTPVLAEAAAAVGLVNVQAGEDGVVREIPLIAEADAADLPSLALATYMYVEGLDGPVIQRPFGLEVGGRVIPTGDAKLFRINFSPGLSPGEAGPLSETVPFVSAAGLLTSAEPVPDLEDKIVFVGATAPILQDFRQTPVAKSNLGVPGVFVHANALNTMLTGEFVYEGSTGETAGWVFFLAAAIGLVSWLTPLRYGVSVPLVLMIGWLLWSLARFEAGVIPDFVSPPLAALFAIMFGLVMRYLTEGQARRRVAALFSQYVPPAVADRLVNEDRVDSVMQGERLDVSVLFCDLRGFTAQAASMEPGEVRLMLDTYYERLSAMVLDHGGTVMQYVGDEIYAAFGAPEIQSDHSARALACAVAMQEARPALGAELEALGLRPIYYGIGVNSGKAVSAIVGSSTKSQYSLVGDTVNIGSRLCSQAREDQVCFPDHVREAAGPAVPTDVEDLGPIEFKNATRPIQVWRFWANREGPDRFGATKGADDPKKSDKTAVSAAE